jgi:hypothetical protein
MTTLPSGLSEIIANEEDLARFITQSNHFSALMAKPAAFLPSKSRETSISRHSGDPKEELWALGMVAAGERKLYGAAIVKANIIRASQLEVYAAEPPPRHAVIKGWPWDETDPDLQKAKQKEIAMVISSQAVLLLR